MSVKVVAPRKGLDLKFFLKSFICFIALRGFIFGVMLSTFKYLSKEIFWFLSAVNFIKIFRLAKPMNFGRKDLGFVLTLALFYAFLLSIPYIFALICAPLDKSFMWHIIGKDSLANTFSWIRQGGEGNILMSIRHIGELSPSIFSAFFFIMGIFHKFTGLSPEFVQFLFRVLLIFPFVYFLHRFNGLFFKGARLRFASIFSLFSAGFGYIVWALIKILPGRGIDISHFTSIPIGNRFFPVDLWLSEIFPFLISYIYTHHVLGAILLLITFLIFIE